MVTKTDTPLPGEVLDANYFVCTLGQAAAVNATKLHPFKTVNQLIDSQAREYPNNPAVGFPIPPHDKKTDNEWDHVVYSKIPENSLLKTRAKWFGVSFPRSTTGIHITGT